MSLTRAFQVLLVTVTVLGSAHASSEEAPATCSQRASAECFHAFDLPGGAGKLRYYASRTPTQSPPTIDAALIILHGHPRDADRSFNAALKASKEADQLGHTLVVAPVFQVPAEDAPRCRSRNTPAAQPGDALWSCGGWLSGAQSVNAGPHIHSFAALDALIAELHRQWPQLKQVTLAGFSAGAQMLQRSVAFAAKPPNGVTLRYVIADPGSWLYFDPQRPTPTLRAQAASWASCDPTAANAAECSYGFKQAVNANSCTGYNQWKYGTQALPAHLRTSAAKARERYRSAQITYLEGELDSSPASGTHYTTLDKSCAAMLQGPFRLQRGLAYLAYEESVLKPVTPRQLIIVPDCAHDVACVLPSAEARPALFPNLVPAPGDQPADSNVQRD